MNETNNYSLRTRNSSLASMKSTLCVSLLIILSSLSLVSSQYVPDNYFINCGSNSDEADSTGKIFSRDVSPSTFKVSGGHPVTNNNAASTPSIYQTARVFDKSFHYELEADENYTYVMVRLHFSPFPTNEFDIFDSKFDVSVSGFSLLSNFRVGEKTEVREFIIPIGSETSFRIEFEPSKGSSSAFVNAIEAFTTPPELFRHGVKSPDCISPDGKHGDLGNLTSDYAFNPIYRINVGGSSIALERDTLRRNWMPDDSFISNSEPATKETGEVKYEGGNGAARFDAPPDVYRTAKKVKNKSVNITWNFGVTKNTMYLVRAHFCDIISPGLNGGAFDFFIYSHYKNNPPIQPGDLVYRVQVPFYFDFVVNSADSRFVNISIGDISGNNLSAFLNGVEIMELIKISGVLDRHNDGKKKKSKSVFLVIACVVGGLSFLLVLIAGYFIGSRYAKVKLVPEDKPGSHVVPSYGRSSYTSINIDSTFNHSSPINLNLNLRVPFSDILQATNSFDENLMIGRGGFGKVYKGTLGGVKVAVKRGEKGHGQGLPEFKTEIMVLSSIRHRHLVSLIGYCDEKSEMILVYEFMEKGTLQDHLYDVDEDHLKLSWVQRLEICTSAARGLHYLHTSAGIIHRDVKSTNILLNEHYVAKVADFGISLLDSFDTNGITDHIKGSFGYLDPEYIGCMKLTQKSDVYSFGVVLLEVLCAKPALDSRLPSKDANLASWAINHIKNRNVDAIIDPFLVDTINSKSLRKFLETVEGCLKETGDERPNMLDVQWDLEYVLKLQQTTVNQEPHEDSIVNSSMMSMSVIQRLPSHLNDDSEVNDNSGLSYSSESKVFSQLNIEEAR